MPTPAPVHPLQVVSFGGGFNLPLWAARDRGFFAQHRVNPTLHITPDSRGLFGGLMDGRYQVAITALDNIVAYQEGQGEQRFATAPDFFAFMGSDDGFLSLVGAPDVASIADLRGKTVSVDAMSNGFSLVLREMLARHGLKDSDVQWARAGGTDRRFAALMERQHSATMLRAPFDIQAQARGFRVLATTAEVIGPYLGICGAARRSWAQANRDATVGFIRAYRDGIRWLKMPTNREAAITLLQANQSGLSREVAQASCERMLHPLRGFFSDVPLDPQGVRAVMDLRSRLGEPPRALTDPNRYTDNSYWMQAMQA